MTTDTPSKLSPVHLSPQQVNDYKEQGFIHLGRILDDQSLTAMRAAELYFRDHPGEHDNQDIHKPGTIFRSQLSFMNEAVRQLCTTGPQLNCLTQLIGPNVLLLYNQFVTKFPDAANNDTPTEFPWHQDNGYRSILPANNVTIWTALDDVDENNGCVWVIPQSHSHGLLSHGAAATGNWHKAVHSEVPGIPVSLRAGESIAFTGLTLHRSLGNHSQAPRRGFFMQYCDAMATDANSGSYLWREPYTWMVSGEIPPMDWAALKAQIKAQA